MSMDDVIAGNTKFLIVSCHEKLIALEDFEDVKTL
jgi:hypothetical protein